MNPLTVADDLLTAADVLATVDRRLPDLAVSAGHFGADEDGIPGRVGRQLYAHWEAALSARAREAAEVAARVRDLAASVRMTARRYAETDEAAARRLEAL